MSKKYKISQNGGYLLTSKKEGHLLNIMEKHYKKYGRLFEIDTEPRPIAELNERIKVMSSPEYSAIYKKLMDIYFNDTQYYQHMSEEGDVIIDSEYKNKIHPYHLNFGALMFINYLIEHELFALLYTTIPCKTESNNIDNGIHPLYVSGTYDLPFKDYVYNHPVQQINLFANKLDNIFQYFMEDFIRALADKFAVNSRDVYVNIVMRVHSEHISNKFDYIYVDWKDRIIKIVQHQKFIGHGIIVDNRIIINTVLVNTILFFFAEYFEYDTTVGGFYDVVNRISDFGQESEDIGQSKPKIIRKTRNRTYGSCITSSLLEMYIMTRLHINGHNISLLLENAAKPMTAIMTTQHAFTKKLLGIRNLTHYATKVKIHVSPTNIMHFRSTSEEEPKRLILDLPFSTRKIDIFKAINYVIYDLYFEYFRDSRIKKKNIHVEKSMMQFIYDRINMFQSMLTNYEVLLQSRPSHIKRAIEQPDQQKQLERIDRRKREQQELERREKERSEQEESEQLERREKERREKERREKERREKERREKERSEQIERNRIEKEIIEREFRPIINAQEEFERKVKEKREQIEWKEKAIHEQVTRRDKAGREQREQVERERIEKERSEQIERERNKEVLRKQLESEQLEHDRREKARRERREKERREQVERERKETERSERIERERNEKALREQVAREQKEKERSEQFERERNEMALHEQEERERREKARHERREKERNEREQIEKARREQIEIALRQQREQFVREQNERALREQSERDRIAKVRREQIEIALRQQRQQRQQPEKIRLSQFEKMENERHEQLARALEQSEKARREQVNPQLKFDDDAKAQEILMNRLEELRKKRNRI